MNQDILYITFILGIKRQVFLLPLKSIKKLEAAGSEVGRVYKLDASSPIFLEFYKYVRDKYGLLYENSELVVTKKALKPDRATITQIRETTISSHLLTVEEDLLIEKIVFFPDICELENEEEDPEYQEELKRAEMIKSLVTTLPEEYRDTNIKE
jgi:hypothetical protein